MRLSIQIYVLEAGLVLNNLLLLLEMDAIVYSDICIRGRFGFDQLQIV